MSTSTSIRTSGRRRIPTRRALEHASESLNVVLSESEDDNRRNLLNTEDVRASEDGDFPLELATPEHESGDIASSQESSISEASTQGSASEAEEDDYDDKQISRKKKAATKSQAGSISNSTLEVRTKGLLEPHKRSATSDGRIELVAGPGKTELSFLIDVRARYGKYPTLPQRDQLRYPSFHRKDKGEVEAGKGWHWYYDGGGKDTFSQSQSVTVMKERDTTNSSPRSRGKFYLLLGPYLQQTQHPLGTLESLNLAERNTFPNGTPIGGSSASTSSTTSRYKTRLDVIVNAGSPVTCMDWVPNQPHSTQYLALGVGQTLCSSDDGQNGSRNLLNEPDSEASSIQIWAFRTTDSYKNKRELLQLTEAEVEHFIYTDCGHVRQLRWCPIPRNQREIEGKDSVSLGLLATIWSDGFARVFDVSLEKNASSVKRHLKYDSAAFAVRPAGTTCTSICWLSPSDVAIGHSNGYIAIYDIYPTSATETNAEPNAPSTSPFPYLTIPPTHPGPVLSVTPAYPTHPTLLATTSLNGYSRLIDLRAPNTDYILTSRSRAAQMTLVYSPHVLSMVMAEESFQTVRCIALRNWGAGIRVGKTSISTTAGIDFGIGVVGRGCLDAGKVHSCIVWGTPDGRVIVSNPVIRLLGKSKVPGWQQVVCRHEWLPHRVEDQPPVPKPADYDPMDIDAEATNDLRGDSGEEGGRRPIVGSPERKAGTARITQGYKPQEVDLKGRGPRTQACTLFEKETAVTAVCWNPNVEFGGWLAMAWGSGLFRVMDVAI